MTENPYNYDAWFDYIRLFLNEQMDRKDVEDLFEKAISNVPPYMVCSGWSVAQRRRLNPPSHR